jgi:DNA invertase Pin-like site-specific DNA recombinase
VAYIRRSVSRAGDEGDISREFQIDKVRTLAGADAARLTILDGDWGRSASTDKTVQRLAFLGLMEDVEAGGVSTVYAYAADRIARSSEWAHRLWNACQRTGTKIVTTEHVFDTSSDADWMLWSVFAQANEMALRGMKGKAAANAQKRAERGDAMGREPYGYKFARAGEVGQVDEKHPDPNRVVLVPDPEEPIAPVLDAWERSGRSFKRCARRLNEGGYRSKTRAPWDRSSLLRFLDREAPDRLPLRAPNGRAEPIEPVSLAKLLRCHCGRMLSPNVHKEKRPGRGRAQSTSYYCSTGNVDRTTHPKVYISESRLLPALKAEAERLAIPFGSLATDGEAAESRRAALEGKRDRVIDTFVEGLIDKEARDRRLRPIDEQLAALASTRAARDVVPSAIDWSWSPEHLNKVLRSLWERVEVGPDLMPVNFVWRVPEWRQAISEPLPLHPEADCLAS